MNKIKKPNSRRNLDTAINRLETNSEAGLQIRSVIANTIVGQMLPEGVIKGGSSLKFRFGNISTRFTKDLDVARGIELDKYIDKLDESLKDGWEGFTGRIVKIDPPAPPNVPGEYIMQPFEVKLSYINKSWLTVPLEIGHDEIGDTKQPDYYISQDTIELFRQLGFADPKPIALVSVEHQIAQKLHALSSVSSERAHDLIDLQLLEKYEEINLVKLKEACQRLFASRKLQEWPPEIVKGEGWDTLYSSQLNDLDVLENVDDAVTWVNQFIGKIRD